MEPKKKFPPVNVEGCQKSPEKRRFTSATDDKLPVISSSVKKGSIGSTPSRIMRPRRPIDPVIRSDIDSFYSREPYHHRRSTSQKRSVSSTTFGISMNSNLESMYESNPNRDNLGFKSSPKLMCNTSSAAIKKQIRYNEHALHINEHESLKGEIALDIFWGFLQEYVAEVFIPSMLMEVLTTSDGNVLESDSFCSLVAFDTYWQISSDVASAMICEIVNETVQGMVEKAIYGGPDVSQNNPLIRLGSFVTTSLLDELTRELVLEVSAEMVFSFLLIQEYEKFVDETIVPLICELMYSARYECFLDDESCNIIHEGTKECCEAISVQVWSEECNLKEKLNKLKEFNSLSDSAEKIIDNLAIRLLLRLIAKRGDRVLYKEVSNSIMVEMMSRKLATILHNHTSGTDAMLLFENRYLESANVLALLETLPQELLRIENTVQIKEAD